jgi:hypothetical protein
MPLNSTGSPSINSTSTKWLPMACSPSLPSTGALFAGDEGQALPLASRFRFYWLICVTFIVYLGRFATYNDAGRFNR